jgi:hypothetical protein
VLGIGLRTNARVTAIGRTEHDGAGDAFAIEHEDRQSHALHARRVIVTTGGRSLPRTGSDGAGYALVRALGHTVTDTHPALVPLVLRRGFFQAGLRGISHEAELTTLASGKRIDRRSGSLLWTHFGISGPAALDVSRHWTRAVQEGIEVRLTLSFLPGSSFEAVDDRLIALVTARPRAALSTVVSELVPTAVAGELLKAVDIPAAGPARTLGREARRRLAHALTEICLPVSGTRGYNYAEVTAGGVPLSEVHGRTLESRRCPGLYFAGEVLDVDGRLGGFNFQWAWSSAMTVARALAYDRPGTTAHSNGGDA